MKTALHNLADERVKNVYEENARFQKLLQQYYSGDTSVYEELWKITYRAACNILKKKLGGILKYEDLENVALDMLAMLFTRINNRTKWPEGYPVINLPKNLENILLTVYYNNKKKTEQQMNILSLDELKENYNYEVGKIEL